MKTLLERLANDDDSDSVEFNEGLYEARQEVREWAGEALLVGDVAETIWKARHDGRPLNLHRSEYPKIRKVAEEVLALVSSRIGLEPKDA